MQFRAIDGRLWLTQLRLAELDEVTVAHININIHLRKIAANDWVPPNQS